MMILKLTLYRRNKEGKPIFVNFATATTFYRMEECTRIGFASDSEDFTDVVEDADQIYRDLIELQAQLT